MEEVKVSPLLETQALSILKAKSPLDSPNFNPTEYLNKLFPNGILSVVYFARLVLTITN
jgi:hypothetical protein